MATTDLKTMTKQSLEKNKVFFDEAISKIEDLRFYASRFGGSCDDLLLKQKSQVQAYLVDEARDEVVAGNAVMAVIYSGEAYLGHEYNNDLAYVIPKEGSNVWFDCWAITKNCENTEFAAKFLDFLCREDVAAANFEYIYYSTPNTKVIEGLDEEDRENESLVPSEDATKNCEVCLQAPDDITALMNDLWKKLKSE